MYFTVPMPRMHGSDVDAASFSNGQAARSGAFSLYVYASGVAGSEPGATDMRTPEFLPPFEYNLAAFFAGWPAHPAGAAAIAIMTRLDNVALARQATDQGRPALDPLQEQFRDALSQTAMNDPQFLRFLGHFMLRVMEQVGYELVQDQVPLPPHRHIVLKSAAVYRRVVAQAA
jgi:hypothetical protein